MGYGLNGELGQGARQSSTIPLNIASFVIEVSGNSTHTAFVKTDGTLWVNGSNLSGQLGLEDIYDSRSSPVQLGVDVIAVTAGAHHTFFLKKDGTLWQVGSIYDSFDAGANVRRTTPMLVARDVQDASGRLFLGADGILRGIGQDLPGIPDGVTETGQKIMQIDTGVDRLVQGSSLAYIKSDGSLWAWGPNSLGQLGSGTYTQSESTPLQVAANINNASIGGLISGYVKQDSTAWLMGFDSCELIAASHSATPLRVDDSMEAIATGGSITSLNGHVILLGTEGDLWVGGSNTSGQLGLGDFGYDSTSPIRIWGWGAYTPLIAPANLLATTTNGYRRLTWQPVVGASHYEILRSETDSPATATKIASRRQIPIFYESSAHSEAAYYWVRAVCPGGVSPLSQPVSIGFPDPVVPSITTHPESQTVTVGASVTFHVVANGTPAPSYQWSKDGVAISGATTSSYTIASASPVDAADYTVTASNRVGSVTSNRATLTVNPAPLAPTISTQPQSKTVTVGESATFSVTATGIPTPSYQWSKNGAAITGATASSHTITSTTIADAGDYSVTVINNVGTITSSVATLTVNPAPIAPLITTHPLSQSATVGGTITLTVVATGTPAPALQWYKNGTAISGAQTAALSITGAQLNDAGSYTVTASNSAGTATSNAASITVTPPPPPNQSGKGGGAPSLWFIAAIVVIALVRLAEIKQRQSA